MSINYSLSLVTAPASEPVTLAEAKTHMRIDSTDDDTYITELITAARILAENYTKRSFINTTWKMFMDRWPCSAGYGRYSEGYHEVPVTDSYQAKPVVLPKGQMQSVTHIKTYDDADTATTVDASNYYVGAYSSGDSGQITLRNGGSISTPTRTSDGIEIQFVAGYGSSASAVPTPIKQAIKMIVSGLYENRGDCSGGNLPTAATALLDQYRIWEL